jgi:PAS domain S-box-containing protein
VNAIDDRQALRVLLVDDRATDAEQIVHTLRHAGFDPTWQRVENESEYVAALSPTLDVILSDVHLSGFDAWRALDLLKARDLDIPFLVVSGSIHEETGVQILKRGAADYLFKDRMARLGLAVQRVIDDRRLQQAKRQAEQALNVTEARMRFALEASQVGIWEIDLTTDLAQWSDILEALHGLPPGGFGGTIEAFLAHIHPDDRSLVRETLARATRDHTDANVVYRTQWPNGTIHWISAIGRTYYDEAGRPVRAAGIGLDVTDRRTLEEQYRQAQKMEAVGQLAGGVAHDFNNLLTAIHGYCELLVDSLGPHAAQQADLAEIRRAADRATSLTRQLLAFSRRQILEPRVLDLRDSLKSIAPMLTRLIGENISVVVDAATDIGRVKADPGQIEQVILNLAVNARDAMPNGGTLTLEVTDVMLDEAYARQHPPTIAGPYVMLAVSDTGVGMDSATQARIFEPFFTTKHGEKGTGLGLSTVYGIVKQSGGYIWVYSEANRGSTFKVYLPRVEDTVDARLAPATHKDVRGSETILVVEDEPSVRELIQRALEHCGYRVLVAATPRRAVEIATDGAPTIDLLISDVVLPQMSGTALATQIVASRPTIRVMYMSGYTDNAVLHHGELSRRTPFLQKPFTPEALARKVREVLG